LGDAGIDPSPGSFLVLRSNTVSYHDMNCSARPYL
jgi:hypothetical protein